MKEEDYRLSLIDDKNIFSLCGYEQSGRILMCAGVLWKKSSYTEGRALLALSKKG